MIHSKKVTPEYFEALQRGDKTFELRREEPDGAAFAVGDYLAVNEYDPGKHVQEPDRYTGRCLLFKITYVLRGYELLADGAVALGLRLMPLSFEDLAARGGLTPAAWTPHGQ